MEGKSNLAYNVINQVEDQQSQVYLFTNLFSKNLFSILNWDTNLATNRQFTELSKVLMICLFNGPRKWIRSFEVHSTLGAVFISDDKYMFYEKSS